MKFYDTNAVLNFNDKLPDEDFLISSVTLFELENIKVSYTKDNEVKFKARKSINLLDKNPNRYKVIIYSEKQKHILAEHGLDETPDNKICACAKSCTSDYEIEFVTDDICARTIAKNIFDLKISKSLEIKDEYTGYREKMLSEEDMAYFYEHLNENIYDLYVNEYLILRNINGTIVDKLKWNGEEYSAVKIPTIKSEFFGTVKPYQGDIYQQLLVNSFSTNKLTMVKGAAGTGKSYLALGYLMSALDNHKIDKIIVFCNTVATANSAKLGYYPGSKNEKLIDSSIGNMLSAKLSGSYGLEMLVAQGKIELLPMSDVRGYDTTGMRAGVYITEAQNMDISLMKLALQRIGDDAICIIDGDYNAQVDMIQYAGANNGMRRLSEVFRGQDFYGEIELKNIYRSRIAAIAENM